MPRLLLILTVCLTGPLHAQSTTNPAASTQPPTTAPAAINVIPQPAPFPADVRTLAFGSCMRQDRPAPIWHAIRDARPDLFVFLGDNIYADTRDMAVMQAKYDTLLAHPAFAELRKTVRIVATWDDHDYGENDVGADYPMKEQSQLQFLRFIGEEPDSPRWHRPGVYISHRLKAGPLAVHLILLDTRYFRSPLTKANPRPPGAGPYAPTTDPQATVLGPDQWRWLQAQLQQPADLRIIGSSIQLVANEHGWEKWGNFPAERQRLLDLIDRDKTPTLIISGDRHVGEASALKLPGGKLLPDFTSSSLNASVVKPRPEPNAHRLGDLLFADNFGLIILDPDARTVRVQLRTAEGKPAADHAYRLGPSTLAALLTSTAPSPN